MMVTLKQLETIDALIKRKYPQLKGISMVQDGVPCFTKYYGKTNALEPMNVASVTKSIISILVGIAIDQGYIKSVDESVLSFFPEYQWDDNNTLREQITIYHLLTMTAPFPFASMKEPLLRICQRKDWVAYGLEMMGNGGQVGSFKYATISTHILSALLTKATKMSARIFANEYLFKPLGINSIPKYPMVFDVDHIFGKKVKGWIHDPFGNNAGGWGLTLTLPDMLKIGELYLHGGQFNEQQVVSKQWVQASLKPIKNQFGYYGFLWWTNKDASECMAIGSGGNMIYINHQKHIVIAIVATVVAKHVDHRPLIDFILDELKA